MYCFTQTLWCYASGEEACLSELASGLKWEDAPQYSNSTDEALYRSRSFPYGI